MPDVPVNAAHDEWMLAVCEECGAVRGRYGTCAHRWQSVRAVPERVLVAERQAREDAEKRVADLEADLETAVLTSHAGSFKEGRAAGRAERDGRVLGAMLRLLAPRSTPTRRETAMRDELRLEVEVLLREHVERVARIVGPSSAAAQALACADSGVHGDRPVFCRPVGARDSYIFVTDADNLRSDQEYPDEEGGGDES